MEIIPAIDLMNQTSVRLYQGQFDQATKVAASPVQQAQQIEAAGVKRLHLVDLDGAKAGRPTNRELIKTICQETGLAVEVGGGIRSLAQINDYLTAGVDRVILGSAAIDNPQLVRDAVNQFGADQIVVGIDGKAGRVATAGWTTQSSVSMGDLMATMVAFGVKTFIVTDIERDGTLTGPNYDLVLGLQRRFPADSVILSGGISGIKDVNTAQEMGIQAVIVGRAMATGALSLSMLAEVVANAR